MGKITNQKSEKDELHEYWDQIQPLRGSLPPLTTQRLMLRALQPTDAPNLLKYYRTPKQTPYVDLQPYTELQEIEAYIEKMNTGIAHGKWLIWAITLLSTNSLIGTLSIWQFNPSDRSAELGYGLLIEHRHQGYMSEALEIVENYGFSELGLAHLDAYTHELNHPSIAFLIDNDYELHGTCIDAHSQTGEPLNMRIYRKSRPSL